MPYYDLICGKCGKREEICCSFTQLDRMVGECCGERMGRDYHAEHFAGVAHRSKGIYPFTEDGITGAPVEVKDYGHHKRLLKENGMDWHEPSAEGRYRRKHIKDGPPKDGRAYGRH
jgi:hypothetical protein